MESAGPRVVLDRLKEQWTEPVDEVTRSELELEKHLWALTALQLRNLDKFARNSQQSLEQLLPTFPQRKHTKILEIGGNVGESPKRNEDFAHTSHDTAVY